MSSWMTDIEYIMMSTICIIELWRNVTKWISAYCLMDESGKYWRARLRTCVDALQEGPFKHYAYLYSLSAKW